MQGEGDEVRGVAACVERRVEHGADGFVGAALGDDVFSVEGAGVVIPQWNVADLGREVVGAEVEGDFAVVEDGDAILQNRAAYGQIEEFVLRVAGGRSFWLWLIRGAVGIDDEVDDRVVSFEIIQADLRAEKGEDLEADEEAIDVGVGDLVRGFKSVDGQVVGFELEMSEAPVKALELDAAAGGFLQFGDHRAADAVPERGGVRPPGKTRGDEEDEEQNPAEDIQHDAQDAALYGSAGGLQTLKARGFVLRRLGRGVHSEDPVLVLVRPRSAL